MTISNPRGLAHKRARVTENTVFLFPKWPAGFRQLAAQYGLTPEELLAEINGEGGER
jgi:hypothetical protein